MMNKKRNVMAKEITTEILIQATPKKVWSVLTNFANYNDWNPFIKSITGIVKMGIKIKARIESPGASRNDLQANSISVY